MFHAVWILFWLLVDLADNYFRLFDKLSNLSPRRRPTPGAGVPINTDFPASVQDSTGSPSPIFPTQDVSEDTETPHPSPQLTDSDFEAHSDYYGLPSHPLSVYHTGDLCKRTGPDTQRVPKELRPICEHPIADVWRELGQQIYQYLDSVNVKWTTIDPVRFAEVEKEAGPLFLWVGVKPGSLSRKDAEGAAIGCKKILKESNLTDVEIAFRESVFTRSTGPRLLNYVPSSHATADVRSPLTPALGLQIAARHTPRCEGTGALYIREAQCLTSSTLTRLAAIEQVNLVATVLLLGSKRYPGVLESVEDKIKRQVTLVHECGVKLRRLGAAGGDDDARARERGELMALLEEAKTVIETLNVLHHEVTESWGTVSQRVLGHIVHSPPLSVGVGPKLFSEDWALIELHSEKIDMATFKGNVIDLGTTISKDEFMDKMYPHPVARTSFKYPDERLFQLRGVVKENELRHPTMLDVDGEPCLIVIKNGSKTGVTFGRATGIESFMRECFEDGTKETSMELAIYPYSHKDGAFSEPDPTDITYASPFFWILEECIKGSFPDAHLYPIKT
ncbi:hypothetical protein EDB89DRAFT_2142029 [Lactarius sanguifluus]|nr:hypothetical protein EDB89DRAFT_2142029 [Lactarius sanguifluus]